MSAAGMEATRPGAAAAGPILLLGADGQLGWELRRALLPLGAVQACGRAEADLSDPAGLRDLLERTRPGVIVNAAAYTAVDRAETDAATARAVNTDAPGLLAAWAAARGAWLVHYSTDYVFDGSLDRPYREDDATAPLGVYGATKLAGEQAVRASGARHLILRTSWVYAARGGNFARTMLRLAAERDSLRVVADQIGAPTSAELIADVSALALHRLRLDPGFGERCSGLYHLSAAGSTSWHGYAREVLAQAAAAGAELRCGPDQVEAIGTADYPTPARRPMNSRLDCELLRQTFGLTLPDWRVQVARMVREVVDRR